ncbi:MAG: RNA polymerase sigma factor [Clostridia bacterium]|nr:RNA polymerase sigma factor [Clostridia bacterium]
MDKKEVETLLQDVKSGDPSAAESLYRLLMPKLYVVAYAVLKDSFLAEDVAHETYIQVYNRIDTYTFTGDACACICTIAYNRALNCLSKLKRENSVDVQVHMQCADSSLPLDERIQQKEVLAEALATLSEEEQYIVLWHVRGGLKHREIAKILHMPLNTVLSKYRRSLQKLRLYLDGQ